MALAGADVKGRAVVPEFGERSGPGEGGHVDHDREPVDSPGVRGQPSRRIWHSASPTPDASV